MKTSVIFSIFLICLNHQHVDGCTKTCHPKQFRCPIGTQRRGKYDMPQYESGGNCYIIRGNAAKDKIARNCWPEEYNLAWKCIDDSGLDCSGPAVFQPLVNLYFEAACYSHDLCYRTNFNAGTQAAQHHCDNQFYYNMRASCDTGSWYWFGTSKVTCEAAAWTAYIAVWDHDASKIGGCWLNKYHNYGRNRRSTNITLELDTPAATDTEKQMNIGNKRQHVDEMFDFEQSYKEFQGRCWDLFRHNMDKKWNETQPLINKCKAKKNQKKSVKCWRKVGKNLKLELEKEKASLIECTDIESNSLNRINIPDTILMKNEPLTREDNIILKRSDLWEKAEKVETQLLDLEDEAVDIIEDTWEQNEVKWKQCWRKSKKIAKKEGIENAEKKIQKCWKMDMDRDIQKELSITT